MVKKSNEETEFETPFIILDEGELAIDAKIIAEKLGIDYKTFTKKIIEKGEDKKLREKYLLTKEEALGIFMLQPGMIDHSKSLKDEIERISEDEIKRIFKIIDKDQLTHISEFYGGTDLPKFPIEGSISINAQRYLIHREDRDIQEYPYEARGFRRFIFMSFWKKVNIIAGLVSGIIAVNLAVNHIIFISSSRNLNQETTPKLEIQK